MTRLTLTFGLLALTVQLFGQTNTIIGSWWSPKGLAGVSYKFDSSGTFKYHSFTCMSEFSRTGHYLVSNDSIFITFDTLSTELKKIYQITTDPPTCDTLFIIDKHKIKVSDYIFLYDKILDKTFTLTDSVFKSGLYCRTHQILFDFDKFTLRPESYPFLDSLVDFLTEYNNLKIEIGQHGTSDPKFSTKLSERRAEAISDYLISKGINKNRLIARGYGDTNPIWSEYEIKKAKIKEEKEKMKQLNKRTEFLILRTDFKDN